MKIKENSFPLVWGQMKKYGYEGQARGRAVSSLNCLNSMEINKVMQFTPAAACPLYKGRRRKNINLNQAMQITS